MITMFARFLYKCRYVFAVLTAVFAAAVVFLWPVGPMWQSPPNVEAQNGFSANRLHGFSPDGTVIVTSFVAAPDASGKSDPVISRWDASSGQLLSRAELPCIRQIRGDEIRTSADGRLALVAEISAVVDQFDYFLHDAITGRRLAGPIQARGFGFSEDGRWLHTRTSRRISSTQYGSIEIRSATTGEPILSCPAPDGFSTVTHMLAPDGASMAIVLGSMKTSRAGKQYSVMIVELPSGKEIRRFDLPGTNWEQIDRWDGRRLQFRLTKMLEPSGSGNIKGSRTFDTTLDPIGWGTSDPLLTAASFEGEPPKDWIDGSESVAYLEWLRQPTVPTPGHQIFLQWLLRIAGVRNVPPYVPPNGEHMIVRVVDRKSGMATYEAVHPAHQSIKVSSSGRLLACMSQDSVVTVWDTAPEPRWKRWPWSLAAGLSVLAVCWLLGRVRWRRTPQ